MDVVLFAPFTRSPSFVGNCDQIRFIRTPIPSSSGYNPREYPGHVTSRFPNSLVCSLVKWDIASRYNAVHQSDEVFADGPGGYLLKNCSCAHVIEMIMPFNLIDQDERSAYHRRLTASVDPKVLHTKPMSPYMLDYMYMPGTQR